MNDTHLLPMPPMPETSLVKLLAKTEAEEVPA